MYKYSKLIDGGYTFYKSFSKNDH